MKKKNLMHKKRNINLQSQTSQIGHINYQFDEFSSKMNIYRLQQILRSAESGNISPMNEFFSEMEEKDSHIFSEISKRKRAVLALPYEVLPCGGSPKDIEIAKWVREKIENIPEIEDHFMILLDAIGYGFSYSELEWEFIDGEYIIGGIHEVHQKNFIWDPISQKINLNDGSVQGAPLKEMCWIKHNVRSKSGYMPRSGLYRSLAYLYLLKNYTLGDFAEFLEVYGLPMRLGKYPLSSSPEERKKLLQAVIGLGHDAAGIVPETMSVEFLEATRVGHEPFLSMIEYVDKKISQVILGSTLTSQNTGAGSYALGKVHNEVRLEILSSDARQLASTINRFLITPLVQLNFGSDQKPPKFTFSLKEEEDMQMYSSALPNLVDLGLDIPTEWVKEKLGIPKSDGFSVLKRA